ncbi:hypothetical protein ACF91D_29475, partial [Staphylococcus sp. 231237_7MaSpsaltlick]|uniref:hypothetical protein n=1 Tax=Staphylococcus sp. 231237_7MaSpsaltlick TaxID=3367518 RepID=UPI00370B7834
MKKIVSSITATLLLSSVLTTQALAEQQKDEKEPELKDDVITYGANLTSQQKDDVREKLGASEKYKSYD